MQMAWMQTALMLAKSASPAERGAAGAASAPTRSPEAGVGACLLSREVQQLGTDERRRPGRGARKF